MVHEALVCFGGATTCRPAATQPRMLRGQWLAALPPSLALSADEPCHAPFWTTNGASLATPVDVLKCRHNSMHQCSRCAAVDLSSVPMLRMELARRSLSNFTHHELRQVKPKQESCKYCRQISMSFQAEVLYRPSCREFLHSQTTMDRWLAFRARGHHLAVGVAWYQQSMHVGRTQWC